MTIARIESNGNSNMERVLTFLDKLDEHNIHFQIDYLRPGALTVFFTLVGARIEADFTVDGASYRLYRGHEDVETDQVKLMALIDGIPAPT